MERMSVCITVLHLNLCNGRIHHFIMAANLDIIYHVLHVYSYVTMIHFSFIGRNPYCIDKNYGKMSHYLFSASLRADSTVSAEKRKGEECSLQSLRNGDQFCVLSSQILWNRLALAGRFDFYFHLCSERTLHVTNIILKLDTSRSR